MRARQTHDRYASLTWLIVVMTVAVLVIGTVAARYVESRLVASKGESLALAAAEIAHKLDLLLAERYSDVRALAQNPLLQGHDAAAKNAYLDSLRTISPLYLLLGVTDAQGRFVAATDRACIGMDMSRSPWFQAARGTRQVHVSDVEPFEEAGGTDAVSFTAPIEGAGGEFKGTVTTRVGLALLENVVARTIRTFQAREESGGNLEYKFVKTTGDVFIDSDLLHKGNVNLKRAGLPSALLSESGPPGYLEEEHAYRHVRVVTGYARTNGSGEFPGLKWTVLLRSDKDGLVAPIRILLWKLAAAWVLVWLPMFGFLFWSTNRLQRERAHTQDEQAHALAAESKYRQLVDQARDIIYRTDDQGRFTFVNPIVTRIMGYSPQELLGRRFIELIRPDARAAAERFYGWQSVRSTPSTYYEFPALTKDGREIWIGQNVQVLLENGQVTGFHAVARDITERKQAETALQASEQRLALVLSATTEGVWDWNITTGEVYYSPGWIESLGYKPEEVPPHIGFWESIVHPDDMTRTQEVLRAHFVSHKSVYQCENRLRMKSGEYRWNLDRGKVVEWNTDGTPHRMVGTDTDIAERKLIESALRNSELRYRTLIANASDAIFLISAEGDEAGRILAANRAAEEMHGYTNEELLAMRITDLDAPAAASEAPGRIRELLAGKKLTFIIEHRHRDGTVFPVEVNASLIELENRRCILAFDRDITKRKQAEEALAASEKRLRTILEAEPECVKVTTEDGVLLDMNAAGLAMIEADSLDQVIGQSVCPLIAPAHRDAFAEFTRRVYRGEPGTLQFELIGLKGAHRWMDTHAVPLRNEHNATIGVLAITRDVTVRKRTEEKLLLSQEIIANAHDPISIMDLQGRFTYQNPAHASLVGFSDDELLGKTPALFLGDDTFASICQELAKTQSYRGEVIARTKDGALKDLDLSVFTIRDAADQSTCFVAIKRDITERKREQKILQALLEGTASVTGEQFFPALVRALAETLGVRHALVTELLKNEQPRLRMLAIWMGDRLGSPAEYDLVRTPCEKVINLGDAYYRHSVQELFPDDKDLVALGAVSYLGIAMKDSSGKTIGHLCILDDKPLPDEHQLTPLLKIFASRAAAELERKLVDEALRESEKRFRTIFDQAPLGIAVIHSATGHFRRINRKYCEIVGYPHSEILTRTFQDITHPDDLQPELDNMTRMMEGRINAFTMEKRYIRKDGAIVWVNLVCVPLWWDYETEGRFHIAMVEDITERKQTEEVQKKLVAELAESRSRFEMFFRQTPSAIAITTIKEGRFLDLNKEAEILTGYSRAELIGRTTREMNLYIDPAERTAVVQQVNKTGMLTNLERLIRNKSGEIRTAVFSLVPIQMGSEPCLLSIAHDITERKQAEAALRERSRQQAIEAELSLLAVTTPDLSTLLNTAAELATEALELDYCDVLELLPDGRDLLLRAGVGWKNDLIGQARTGMSPSSLASMTLRVDDLVIVQDLPAETRFSGPSWLRDHGIVSGISVTIHSKEGYWGTLGVYTTRQRRFSQGDINFLQTVSSILATAIERTQAEVVLRNANEALRRLSRQLLQVQEEDRRAIARDLHDEIGQSLTAIKLNVERAQRASDRSARTRIMRDCAQITDNVLEQVRDLSLNLHPSILDDLGLAHALKWYADRQAERAGLRIQVAADSSLPRLSHDIEIACFRIAQEALTNVVRHAKASRASVTLTRGTSSVELSIRDDGTGFVMDAIAPPITGKTSIGLTSMQERARLLGGEIKITSEPTQGTEVIATLPLAFSAEAPATEASRS